MNNNTKNSKTCSFKNMLVYALVFALLLFINSLVSSSVDEGTTARTLFISLFIVASLLLNIVGITFFTLLVVCYFYKIIKGWKNIRLGKLNIVKFFLGPWMLGQQAVLGTIFILSKYERPMETGVFDKYLFFQGSIDMGSELIFVATIALYVLFGFTASWYVVFKLEEIESKISFPQTFMNVFWILKYHIMFFFFWSILVSSNDSRIVPNDFRNMFLLVTLLYFLSILLIVIMHKLNIPRVVRLLLAPIFIVIWLIIGSDGNTARAEQIPIWHDNPHYMVRSKKHATMIEWHNLCDDFFGDPKPHYTHLYEK